MIQQRIPFQKNQTKKYKNIFGILVLQAFPNNFYLFLKSLIRKIKLFHHFFVSFLEKAHKQCFYCTNLHDPFVLLFYFKSYAYIHWVQSVSDMMMNFFNRNSFYFRMNEIFLDECSEAMEFVYFKSSLQIYIHAWMYLHITLQEKQQKESLFKSSMIYVSGWKTTLLHPRLNWKEISC